MFWRWLKELICGKELPIWAYGLECDICKMTFINPETHFEYVKENNLEKKHSDKIPILK